MDAAHAFEIVKGLLCDYSAALCNDKSLDQKVDQIVKFACAAQLAETFSTQEPRLVNMVRLRWVRKAIETAEMLKYFNPEKYDVMFKTCQQALLASTPTNKDEQLAPP